MNPFADALAPTHLILLLLAVVLLFGTKRLPEIGRSLGTGIREFKQSITSLSSEGSASKVESETPPT